MDGWMVMGCLVNPFVVHPWTFRLSLTDTLESHLFSTQHKMYSLDSTKYKTLATSRNLTYSYFVQLTSQPSLPTLLLLHGFPCQSADWHHQIAHFSKLGYGLIVPDLLGYGGTDKPTDAKLYGLKGMAGDVKEILEKEHVDSVVVVGHDWSVSLRLNPLLSHSLP